METSYGRALPTGMTVTGDGGPVGGLTSLEYLKGLVITAYENMIQSTGYNPLFSATVPSASYQYPAVPSGSHVYDRSGAVGYAQPTNSPTIEFGTVGTPYALLNQIVDGGGDASLNANATSCPGNIVLDSTSTLWNNTSSIQGQLLQRVQEIDPTYTPAQMLSLLNASGSQIDLGWSDVIYWNDGTAPTGTPGVTIQPFNPSNPTAFAGPSWLKTQLVAMSSGGNMSATLDGTPTPLCNNQPWDAIDSNNAVNATKGNDGNAKGDLDLHDAPFTITGSGGMTSWDGALWTSSAGKGGLLGQLLFQQNTNASGTAAATFSGPN